MPPTTPKPTILFIPGSWHTPAHFSRIRTLFSTHSYPTLCPPHASSHAFPPIGLLDDARLIHETLTQLIVEEHKTVIVIAHSYGCMVMTQAVTQDLSLAHREKNGLQGGVVDLLYVCGFMVLEGESLSSALGGGLPDWIVVDEHGQTRASDAENILYHDLPEEERKKWAAELVPQPTGTQFTSTTNTGYLYCRTTYLFAEEDRALPLFLQKMLVDKVREKTGITVNEETCSSSHSVCLSMPEKVLEVVERMVGGS